jgi:hypothetical protein
VETYEVEAGLVLHTNRAFFKVEEVREPHHPLFGGLVFEGHYFDIKRQVWSRRATLSAPYGRKWLPVIGVNFPDLYFSAYLKQGDKATIKDFDNGAWVWTPEVKCKVMDFRESTSLVKVTGKALQFSTGVVYEVPSQRLYRRKAAK